MILTPLLILIGGKPGTGKSTLAQRLARPEQLGLPLLSRDAIKVGLVETYALSEPTLSRVEVESDARRSTIVPNSFSLFHDTIAQWLRAGVSLIAEHSFTQRSTAAFVPMREIATVVFVECRTSDEEAQRRFLERELRDPRQRPDRLALMQLRIDQGSDPWTTSTPFVLDVPTLHVDTTDGYTPTVDQIVTFCRKAMTIE
ncbi:MAG: AAA family ATPase [Caldilineaceae bacterium]